MPNDNLNAELMIRLSQVPAIVQSMTGEPPHVSSIHRWTTRGIRGVRLRTRMVGGTRRTCKLWLEEFFDAVTEAADLCHTEAPQGSARRRRNRAEAELAADGI